MEQAQPLSKTQRKKEMHSLQVLGTALTRLREAQLGQLTLPDDLRAAIADAKRIRSHEGLRRQMQYIGRLMRAADADTIRTQLDALLAPEKHNVGKLHLAERWRERLLQNEKELAELAARYPDAELEPLRALLLAAREEQVNGQPPRRFRELFRTLYELVTSEVPTQKDA